MPNISVPQFWHQYCGENTIFGVGGGNSTAPQNILHYWQAVWIAKIPKTGHEWISQCWYKNFRTLPNIDSVEAVAKPSLVNFIFANIPSFITWPNLNQPSCPCQLSSVNIWNEIIFPLLKKPTTRTLSTHYCQRMNANKFNYWVEIWFFIYVSFQILHVHLDLTLGGLKNCLIIIWGLFINIV